MGKKRKGEGLSLYEGVLYGKSDTSSQKSSVRYGNGYGGRVCLLRFRAFIYDVNKNKDEVFRGITNRLSSICPLTMVKDGLMGRHILIVFRSMEVPYDFESRRENIADSENKTA